MVFGMGNIFSNEVFGVLNIDSIRNLPKSAIESIAICKNDKAIGRVAANGSFQGGDPTYSIARKRLSLWAGPK